MRLIEKEICRSALKMKEFKGKKREAPDSRVTVSNAFGKTIKHYEIRPEALSSKERTKLFDNDLIDQTVISLPAKNAL